MKGISAIVATYQRKIELRRLFDSLILNKSVTLEVIIVDQNIDDLLDELINEYSTLLNIRHIKMDKANQSKARNLGAAKAKYDIVCFPDDDCWFEAGALDKVKDYFEKNGETDLMVANWRQNAVRYPQSGNLTRKEIFSFRALGYVTYVLFFKASAFRMIGGFVENIGLGQYIGGGEDTEITFRVASKELKIFYNSEVEVNHKYTPINTRELKFIRLRERAMGYLYAKYKVPFVVIIRGFAAPVIKGVLSFNRKKMKEFYNMLMARIEGYRYYKKQGADIYPVITIKKEIV